MSAFTDLRPVDGAGTWEPSPSHSTLHLTYLGTLVVCAVLVGAFVLVVHAGQSVVCRMDKATTGAVQHSYCPSWHAPSEVQR